jgi:hypothetical protein
MDPNEALRLVRKAFTNMEQAGEDNDPSRFVMHAEDAREAFDALDGWLSRGGFLPRDWASKTLEAPK